MLDERILNETDLKRAWEMLKQGKSISIVSNFFGISSENLEKQLRTYYHISDGENLSKRINNEKGKGKPVSHKISDMIAIKAANYSCKKNLPYAKFVKTMEESGGQFSQKAIEEIKKIYSRKETINKKINTREEKEEKKEKKEKKEKNQKKEKKEKKSHIVDNSLLINIAERCKNKERISYEEFIKTMEESGREFSEEAIEIVKKIILTDRRDNI